MSGFIATSPKPAAISPSRKSPSNASSVDVIDVRTTADPAVTERVLTNTSFPYQSESIPTRELSIYPKLQTCDFSFASTSKIS